MIEFKNVSKTYPNGVKGLKNVDLTIDQGEFVAIIGLSGAGKSTLIRTINRMIDITEGQLIVDGVDVMTLHGKSMRRFRRRIGMIFQSFNLVTRSTAIKNVLTSMVPDMNFVQVLLGLFSKEQKMKALEALRRSAAARGPGPHAEPVPLHHPGGRARCRAGSRDRASGHERLQAHQ